MFEGDEADKAAYKALDLELEGRLSDSRRLWGDMQKTLGSSPWGLTAGRQLANLDEVDKLDDKWQKDHEDIFDYGREPENFSRLEAQAFRAFRAENFGYFLPGELSKSADPSAAHALYESLKKDAREAADFKWLPLAAKKEAALSSEAKADADKVRDNRKATVARVVEFAKKNKITDQRRARLAAMDVVAVYGDGYEEVDASVQEAKKLLLEIKALQGEK
jgi:hypothetical protein